LVRPLSIATSVIRLENTSKIVVFFVCGVFSACLALRARQLEKSFRRQRKRLAQKLSNPRLTQIHLHTFKHWKATMEYYRTRDIFHVVQFLGHRKIENTLLYVQLVNSIFQEVDD
jgi:glutaredoxin 2